MPTVRFWSATPSFLKPHAGYHWHDVLKRLTPGNDGVWGGIRAVGADDEADWTVIINHVLGANLKYNPARTIVLQNEPDAVRDERWGPWRYPERMGVAATWTIAGQHFPLDWYLTATYTQLRTVPIVKTCGNVLSAVQTMKTRLYGHQLRVRFVHDHLRDPSWFRLYGPPQEHPCYVKVLPMRAKDVAMLPFKYHFCAENSQEPHYFTEKLGDAFLAECLPFYWGAPDWADWFPPESLIWVPLEEPEHAREIIVKAMQDSEWEKRLPAIREAKRLVLEKYQVWAVLHTIISSLR